MSVVCLTKMEAGAQQQVEKIVVLIEADAEEESMHILELFDGVEALKQAVLDLPSRCKCGRRRVCQNGHRLFPANISFRL